MSLEKKLDFKTVYVTEEAFGWSAGNPKEPYAEVYHTDAAFQYLVSTLNLPFKFEGEHFKSKSVPQFDKQYDPDFSNEMVVAVFQGQRASGGYSIEVTKIVEYDDKIVVSATAIEPSGGIAAAVMTYPAHFVACQKSDKFVELDVAVRDTYAERMAHDKTYMIYPPSKKKQDFPDNLSQEERRTIIKQESAVMLEQLKKDCEPLGIKDIKFLHMIQCAILKLEPEQAKYLESKGYAVFKDA